MLLDVLHREAIFSEKGHHIVTVVALELEDLAHLIVVDDAAVAVVFLRAQPQPMACQWRHL